MKSIRINGIRYSFVGFSNKNNGATSGLMGRYGAMKELSFHFFFVFFVWKKGKERGWRGRIASLRAFEVFLPSLFPFLFTIFLFSHPPFPPPPPPPLSTLPPALESTKEKIQFLTDTIIRGTDDHRIYRTVILPSFSYILDEIFGVTPCGVTPRDSWFTPPPPPPSSHPTPSSSTTSPTPPPSSPLSPTPPNSQPPQPQQQHQQHRHHHYHLGGRHNPPSVSEYSLLEPEGVLCSMVLRNIGEETRFGFPIRLLPLATRQQFENWGGMEAPVLPPFYTGFIFIFIFVELFWQWFCFCICFVNFIYFHSVWSFFSLPPHTH